MTIEHEREEAVGFLAQSCNHYPRSAAMLTFALEQGLDKAMITLPNGKERPAAAYAQHLMCLSTKYGKPEADEDIESYFIVCLMVALEDSRQSDWSYGSYLNYQMKTSNVLREAERTVCNAMYKTAMEAAKAQNCEPPAPAQIKAAMLGRVKWEKDAFYACHGSSSGAEGVSELLNNNILAVSMYCARLQALHYSMPNYTKGFHTPNDNGEPIRVLDAPKETPRDTLAHLARTYIPALIGEDKAKLVEQVLMWLYKRKFFEVPATTLAGFTPVHVSLVQHTVDVIYRAAADLLPANAAQIGEIVLAGLCHDFADLIPSENLTRSHGYTSLDIALDLFGSNIPLSVASAIDGCMNDISTNINIGVQMETQPLTLFLHIADTMASYIDEACVEVEIPASE